METSQIKFRPNAKVCLIENVKGFLIKGDEIPTPNMVYGEVEKIFYRDGDWIASIKVGPDNLAVNADDIEVDGKRLFIVNVMEVHSCPTPVWASTNDEALEVAAEDCGGPDVESQYEYTLDEGWTVNPPEEW